MPSNNEFLSILFGEDAPFAHVTDFHWDPNNIPTENKENLVAWAGNWASKYTFSEQTNEYFCISTFFGDDEGKARRRKALFRATHVIVLDDVKEKLSLEQVKRLPQPTYILETSHGSEQWGYRLVEPCTDRNRVDNLLDGLVACDLAPTGKDPGMKGVTRYVRLPEGYNTKVSKMVAGVPFKCRMLEWNPFNSVTLEELAAPFLIDLDVQRREQRVDGAAAVSDHPLLHIPDTIHVKEERSDGRFDITCPWVDEHTGEADDGAAIFTNADGSIGFKCHHGACESRTGKDLLQFIEAQSAGFGRRLRNWQTAKTFGEIINKDTPATSAPDFSVTTPDFIQSVRTELPTTTGNMDTDGGDDTRDVGTDSEQGVDDGPVDLNDVFARLQQCEPGSEDRRVIAEKMLQFVDGMEGLERLEWHENIRLEMTWTKQEMKNLLTELRKTWWDKAVIDQGMFEEMVYVRSLNQIYQFKTRVFLSMEAFQNMLANKNNAARRDAFEGGMLRQVDYLDYAPGYPQIFQEDNAVYGNTWSTESERQGVKGDVSCWLNHWKVLGFSDREIKHAIQYLAYTLRHPENKINHYFAMGGGQGIGKDWLLYALMLALGRNATTINGEDLLSSFNEYLFGTKLLNVNEVELGNRRDTDALGPKLKMMSAAPPDKLPINIKGLRSQQVRNIVSIVMTTNSYNFLKMAGDDRRVFALWSDVQMRGSDGAMTPAWKQFWHDAWNWMLNGGADAVIYHLRNEVDLSDFDPGAPPPRTEYLEDVVEASKPDLVQTIESFISERAGCFEKDLVTIEEIVSTLRAGMITHEHLIECDTKKFTPGPIKAIIRKVNGAQLLRAKRKSHQQRVWCIRNADHYRTLVPSDLLDEYKRQTDEFLKNLPAKVVKR